MRPALTGASDDRAFLGIGGKLCAAQRSTTTAMGSVTEEHESLGQRMSERGITHRLIGFAGPEFRTVPTVHASRPGAGPTAKISGSVCAVSGADLPKLACRS